METKKTALFLYIASSFLAIVATILENDLLLLLTKPIILPAIFFYYLSIKKQKTDMFFVLLLVSNFIGDTIVLLEFDNQTSIIMIPFFISYLFLLKFAIEDIRKLSFSVYGICVSIFVFSFLMFLLYSLIQLFAHTNKELVIPVIIYGVVLALYGSISSYCFALKNSSTTFYMLMVALTSTVSDVFYIMFSLIFHFKGFNYFEFSVQLLSYFFMVKYFVSREESKHHLPV